MEALTLLGAILLAAVHLFSGRLTFLGAIPRSRWLSLAGGVSVAYVFVHLLPELESHRTALPASGPFERPVYLAALLGLSVFYGLERLVREDERRGGQKGEHSLAVFWLHVLSFALYNALIGYLLVDRGREEAAGLPLYLLALGLHFVINDHALRHEHKDSYHRLARWLLAAAVLAGWVIGVVATIAGGVVAFLFAVLAGGIILNVLKEELPEERQSKFWAFAAGAGGYALLLMLV